MRWWTRQSEQWHIGRHEWTGPLSLMSGRSGWTRRKFASSWNFATCFVDPESLLLAMPWWVIENPWRNLWTGSIGFCSWLIPGSFSVDRIWLGSLHRADRCWQVRWWWGKCQKRRRIWAANASKCNYSHCESGHSGKKKSKTHSKAIIFLERSVV